ncbi:MAG: FkbM family methyltransferase [Solirubrobacterales bacterium]
MTVEGANTARNPLLRAAQAIKRIGPIWRRTPRRFFLLSQHRRLRKRISFRRRGFHWTGFAWDSHVTWSIYAHGDYQGEERRAVVRWLRRNGYLTEGRDLVVEVGANIGTTSLPLARDDGCRVLAIEPDPDNFELLQANVRRNGLEDRIACERAAVAGRSGAATLVVPAEASGGAQILRSGGGPPRFGGDLSGEIRGFARTRTAPLSELLRERAIDPTTIAFVWSDAQGSDGYVISTAPELWAAGVPLYMELWPAGMAQQGCADAVRAAQRYGFRAFIECGKLIAREVPVAQPITELRRLADSLQGNDQTDVLLIPERGSPG